MGVSIRDSLIPLLGDLKKPTLSLVPLGLVEKKCWVNSLKTGMPCRSGVQT